MEAAATALPYAQQLDFELEVLRSIPNATSIGFYPKEGSASVSTATSCP